MTQRRPGQHPDELMSAAISGDLTDDEHARLDAHLAGCESCRQTMAAWAEQRRLVSQLRGVPVPRDLAPRIRAGIESGAYSVPWWRRRTGLLVGIGASLATVTAALVAAVVIGDMLPGPQVASTGSAAASASLTPGRSASVEATPAPSPTPTPPGIAPEAIPPFYLAYAGPSDSVALTMRDGDQGTTERELPMPPGQPIRAALSPNGRWLAYITPVGQKGTNKYWAVNTEDGTHVELGESGAIGSPFTNGLFWSPDSRYLTFTLTDESGKKTDAWAFNTTDLGVHPLTERGDAVAAGWRAHGADEGRAWVSVASADPISYEVPDLANLSLPQSYEFTMSLAGVFQPLWSSDGSAAIFWRGTLNPSAEAGYEFAEGGAPYLARDAGANPSQAVDDATLLFSDVSIGREAFTSAAITWGAATDAYAVWDARWSGLPQSGDGSPYPDEGRIYFSHASDERNIRAGHALDAADLPDDAYVSSVAIAPLGTDYLAVTIGFPVPGDLAVPEGETLLIKRNTGSVPDDLVRTLRGNQQGWYGPAVYP
jgi:hypothetical protein